MAGGGAARSHRGGAAWAVPGHQAERERMARHAARAGRRLGARGWLGVERAYATGISSVAGAGEGQPVGLAKKQA